MAIAQGLYKVYIRYGTSSSGPWTIVNDNILTYVQKNSIRRVTASQYNLVSRGEVAEDVVSFIQEALNYQVIPLVFDHTFLLTGSAWADYTRLRTECLNTLSSIGVDASIPTAYTTADTRLYYQVSLDESFTTILYTGYVQTSTATGEYNWLSKMTGTSYDLNVIFTTYEYIESTDELWAVNFTVQVNHASGNTIVTFINANPRAVSESQVVKTAFENATPYQPIKDPYEAGGGASGTGGGEGNFDGTSVDVDFASLPTLSAVDTGFITLYNPNIAQLRSLANYMWSSAFDLDTFKKLFADPMQAILGLSIVPGPVPSAGTQDVKVGNISTGISMTKAASQYIDVDCGTLNVEEFWGAYLDYEPYTKAEIYLPYIGTHQIAVDDIMGKAVHIKYHIDILSGACAAEIKCGGSVLYTFIGSVAVSIPVTGNDWTNVINGVLSIAGAVGSLVATGGAAAPAAAGEIASAAVNSLKPNIEKSGAVSGGGGLMAGKVPVLILTRPRQALPASQNEYTGYPAFITRSLGAVSGYTEVHKIRLGGISATDAELDEIENLLKGGVIL